MQRDRQGDGKERTAIIQSAALGSLSSDLEGLVVDPVGQWVGPHAHIQVGVAEPLHRLVHIGHRSQGDLRETGMDESQRAQDKPLAPPGGSFRAVPGHTGNLSYIRQN